MKRTKPTTKSYYSLLNVDHDAPIEEIHRAYKRLSTTFHPDKLPHELLDENKEKIQQVFLEFKLANDILTDPVLRLAYDMYGEEAVTLIKRIRQHQREQANRKAASASMDFDGEDVDEDGEDEDEVATLYERLERLLATNPIQAREELQEFMEQYEYHQTLLQASQVQLSCTMDFPPVVDLKSLVWDGKRYLENAERSLETVKARAKSKEEMEFSRRRIQMERRLVDYQLNRVRESQKAEVGMSLTSVQAQTPGTVTTGEHPLQPKWSMTMGGSTDLVYPDVANMMELIGKEPPKLEHPASIYASMFYQPVPDTQVYVTANLSNDESHQFVLGSSRVFASRTSFRYNLTYLPKASLNKPVVFNFVSFRHIKDVGMASGGLSMVANGEIVQGNVKLEAVAGTKQNQKYSAKVSIEGRSGPSLTLGYKCRFQKYPWLESFIKLPKRINMSLVIGQFSKISGVITQEFASLASNPTLGFGFEHEITLGCWKWIWELTYQNSTYRIPVPVCHLGSIVDPGPYYLPKLYYGIYCLLIQAMLADLVDDDEKREGEASKVVQAAHDPTEKSQPEGERQLALMSVIAEGKRNVEQARNGFVVLRSAYWVESREIGLRPRTKIISMDATTQLQFWVVGGKLSLPSTPKSSWLGFYNLQTEARTPETQSNRWDWRFWRRWTRQAVGTEPCTPLEPKLTIRYSYERYVYEITVGDTEAVDLPCERAQFVGQAGRVQ